MLIGVMIADSAAIGQGPFAVTLIDFGAWE
jgi:hypothetical protein